MKESNGKKASALKAFKVIMIIYSCIMLVVIAQTVFGWATGTSDLTYEVLAPCTAAYCASLAAYECAKKKENKKKEETIE